MMVLLRITIGWHFLYQGLEKLNDPDFTSATYLTQAKGPLTEFFHDMIPDYDGRQRLGVSEVPAAAADDNAQPPAPVRGQVVIDRWRRLVDEAKAHYQLTGEKREAADAVFEKYRRELTRYLDANEADIEDYFFDLDKLARDKANANFNEVPYQRQRLWERSQGLRSTANVWLSEIERMTDSMLDEIHQLATPDDRQAAGGRYEPPRDKLDWMDDLVTYSNIAIGFCLMAGLFTRLASFSGGLFLLLIVLSQPAWPSIYPPAPPVVGRSLIVTKEFIEMMAMFTLAATHVGRWGGLDFFIHYGLVRPLFGKKETS